MKAKCIIDHEHYWLECGKIYGVKDYDKNKDCYIVTKLQTKERDIYAKELFEVVEDTKPRFKNKYN